MRYQAEAKKCMALEKMMLALSLTMCNPEDLAAASEAVEQIDDLINCYKDIRLGQDIGSKVKAKPGKENSKERKQAFSVLFDTLIAQLMKQQNFVREMANYVFAQFCGELDMESLEHILNIVQQTNEQTANEILQEDDGDESNEDEYGDEDEDGSDLD